jgi:hypothetical protein
MLLRLLMAFRKNVAANVASRNHKNASLACSSWHRLVALNDPVIWSLVVT